MAINKLNKTFTPKQILTAEEMNQITGKIDEVIEPINNPAPPAGGYNRAVYEAAGAVFNEESGYYELNGLTDITEEEMINIYVYTNQHRIGSCTYNNGASVRTNLPLISTQDNVSTRLLAFGFRGKVFLLPEIAGVVLDVDSMFFNSSVTRCVGILYVNYISSTAAKTHLTDKRTFDQIVFIQIHGLAADIYLPSNNLEIETLIYLIENSAATSAINVKVSPTVYAKITDEINTEWNGLIAMAAEKNITFVSA